MRRFLLISLGVHLTAALIALLILLAPHRGDAPAAPPALAFDETPVEVVRDPGTDASPPPAPPPRPEQGASAPPAPAAPQADDGPPPPAPSEQAAAPSPPKQREQPQVRLDLGASGLTDDVQGEDLVPPGPDPAHQNIPPRYPRGAAARGEKGIVALFVKVAPTGEVEDAEVLKSSGHDSLDDAARDAVLRWRFIPAKRDGLAIESERVESFNFE